MQMRPPLQIQSMIKAMVDVVLPALDPHNKLAQEQARLIVGMLGMMAQQMPLQYRFDCDESARLISFARELQQFARGGSETGAAVAALAEQTGNAKCGPEVSTSAPGEIERQVRELRRLTGAVVTAVFHDGEPAARVQVGKSVLDMSKAQLLRDRSWVLAQGWEPDPASVPPIEQLLASPTEPAVHR
ncbi:MAG: hypothetical protein JWR16_865 [Nevskia sp.]|nr:hypothetical protein [Nevskia sp.]